MDEAFEASDSGLLSTELSEAFVNDGVGGSV